MVNTTVEMFTVKEDNLDQLIPTNKNWFKVQAKIKERHQIRQYIDGYLERSNHV